MRYCQTLLKPILVGIALCGGAASAAHAASTPAPFTWNPAGASPALDGSAFTADTISATFYVRVHPFSGGTGSVNGKYTLDLR